MSQYQLALEHHLRERNLTTKKIKECSSLSVTKLSKPKETPERNSGTKLYTSLKGRKQRDYVTLMLK